MGKWAQVRCACDNRTCDHADGLVVEVWPGDVIRLGALLTSLFKETPVIFEIYRFVGDSRNYPHEELRLTTEQADLWRTETAELQKALQSEGDLPYRKIEKLKLEWLRHEADLRRSLEKNVERIVPLREGLRGRNPTADSAVEGLRATLEYRG